MRDLYLAADTYLAADAEGPNPVLPVREELIIGVLGFALLCWILVKYVFPRVEQAFRQRIDTIEGGIKRAEEAQAEANKQLEQYRQQLADVRTEATRIRDEARADAAGIRDEILIQAREESDRIIAAGRDALAAERSTIVREVRAELGRLTVDLADQIIGEALTNEARRHSTVERFLAELGEGPEPAGAEGAL